MDTCRVRGWHGLMSVLPLLTQAFSVFILKVSWAKEHIVWCFCIFSSKRSYTHLLYPLASMCVYGCVCARVCTSASSRCSQAPQDNLGKLFALITSFCVALTKTGSIHSLLYFAGSASSCCSLAPRCRTTWASCSRSCTFWSQGSLLL